MNIPSTIGKMSKQAEVDAAGNPPTYNQPASNTVTPKSPLIDTDTLTIASHCWNIMSEQQSGTTDWAHLQALETVSSLPGLPREIVNKETAYSNI